MEMTLHGEQSTDSSDEGVSWRRNVKVFKAPFIATQLNSTQLDVELSW